jgi:hypothetical protein
MAVKAVAHFHGTNIEVGTFTLDPASVAAAAQGLSTVTVTGAKVGDLVFVNAEALDNRIVCTGAKVTAPDTVTVYINNMYDSTTAVDGASKTWSYLLFHLS